MFSQSNTPDKRPLVGSLATRQKNTLDKRPLVAWFATRQRNAPDKRPLVGSLATRQRNAPDKRPLVESLATRQKNAPDKRPLVGSLATRQNDAPDKRPLVGSLVTRQKNAPHKRPLVALLATWWLLLPLFLCPRPVQAQIDCNTCGSVLRKYPCPKGVPPCGNCLPGCGPLPSLNGLPCPDPLCTTTAKEGCAMVNRRACQPCNATCGDCLNGFEQVNGLCQPVTDNCVGNQCQNGALCIDGLNSYTCQCVGDYAGSFCERDCAGICTIPIKTMCAEKKRQSCKPCATTCGACLPGYVEAAFGFCISDPTVTAPNAIISVTDTLGACGETVLDGGQSPGGPLTYSWSVRSRPAPAGTEAASLCQCQCHPTFVSSTMSAIQALETATFLFDSRPFNLQNCPTACDVSLCERIYGQLSQVPCPSPHLAWTAHNAPCLAGSVWMPLGNGTGNGTKTLKLFGSLLAPGQTYDFALKVNKINTNLFANATRSVTVGFLPLPMVALPSPVFLNDLTATTIITARVLSYFPDCSSLQSNTDVLSTAFTFRWTQVEGPVAAVLQPTNTQLRQQTMQLIPPVQTAQWLPGRYVFQLEVFPEQSPRHVARANTTVIIQAPPPVAVISGGSRKVGIPVGTSFALDGTKTYDPTSPTQTTAGFYATWSCSLVLVSSDGSLTEIGTAAKDVPYFAGDDSCFVPLYNAQLLPGRPSAASSAWTLTIANTDAWRAVYIPPSQLSLPTNTMLAHKFSLTATAMLTGMNGLPPRDATTSVLLVIVPTALTELEVFYDPPGPPQNLNNFDTNEDLVLNTRIANPPSAGPAGARWTYTWKVVAGQRSEELETAVARSNKPTLFLSPGLLQWGQQYVFSVDACEPGQSDWTKCSTAYVRVRTNTPPAGGQCGVTPTTGKAYETIFRFNCSGWVDRAEDFPLTYRFDIVPLRNPSVAQSQEEELPVTLSDYHPLQDVALRLPGGQREILAFVRDAYGAVTRFPFFVSVEEKVFEAEGDAEAFAKQLAYQLLGEAFSTGSLDAMGQAVVLIADLLSVTSRPAGPAESEKQLARQAELIEQRQSVRNSLYQGLKQATADRTDTAATRFRRMSLFNEVVNVPQEVGPSFRGSLLNDAMQDARESLASSNQLTYEQALWPKTTLRTLMLVDSAMSISVYIKQREANSEHHSGGPYEDAGALMAETSDYAASYTNNLQTISSGLLARSRPGQSNTARSGEFNLFAAREDASRFQADTPVASSP
eukprot:g26869.t1